MLDDKDEFELPPFSNENLRRLYEKYCGREQHDPGPPIQTPQPVSQIAYENPHLQKMVEKYAGR